MPPANSQGHRYRRGASRRELTVAITSRFAGETLRGVRREAGEVSAASLEAAVANEPMTSGPPSAERRRYMALCERAWLHWTRQALDHATQVSLNQTTAGPLTPTEILQPSQAAEAAERCRIHDRLLETIGEASRHAAWIWQLEAARHVHVSTETALKTAARTVTWTREDVEALRNGVDAAADALVAAMVAGFVEDPAREFAATIRAITRADLRS